MCVLGPGSCLWNYIWHQRAHLNGSLQIDGSCVVGKASLPKPLMIPFSLLSFLLCLRTNCSSWLGVRCGVEFQDQISGRPAALRLLSGKSGRVPGHTDQRRTPVLPVRPTGMKSSELLRKRKAKNWYSRNNVHPGVLPLNLFKGLLPTTSLFIPSCRSFCLIYSVSYIYLSFYSDLLSFSLSSPLPPISVCRFLDPLLPFNKCDL